VRALLLYNPHASTTDPRIVQAVSSTLSEAVDLDARPTKQRGHATHLAAGAVHEGVDIVFALGGDGTANEVLQALAGSPVALGILPGGSTNVLVRALGLPNDPLEAARLMVDHLRAGRRRTITLGRVGQRYLGFNAGFGFDAAVVRHVEQHDHRKRWLGQGAFVISTAQEWFGGSGREQPETTLRLPDGTTKGPYAVTIVANTDPYTYLRSRPMHVHPKASFDTGLDLLALRKVSSARLIDILWKVFRDGSHIDAPAVDYFHDLDGFELVASHPQPLMVDGDYAGEHRDVRFTAVRQALTVLA
jgi:diacylglycerol kinase family enzyme